MNNRPVDLGLLHQNLPVMGWVSILHRITGVILVVALPFCLWLLQHSLSSEQAYSDSVAMLSSLAGKTVVLILVASLAHHLFAGLRHLAMDLHCGVEYQQARLSAQLVLIANAVVIIVVAWRLFK